MVGFTNPTLKRGAYNRCAYGAGAGPQPAWNTSTLALLRGHQP
jgi:hypothetical protein